MAPDKADALLRQFNETLRQWIAWLDDYSFTELLRKPRPGAWSLGQMYVHLIHSTEHFISHARLAAAADIDVIELKFILLASQVEVMDVDIGMSVRIVAVRRLDRAALRYVARR